MLPDERLALGVSMTRPHRPLVLQQTVDWENSLALLFARQDYRDYFEREGFGAYATSDWLGVSTTSVHLRSDRYRSLPLDSGTRSWFNRGVALRDNPPVAESEARTLSLRFERMTRRAARAGHGLAHWVALEHGGGRLGGDFRYTRGLADLRGMLRLSPATTLALRAIAGETFDGTTGIDIMKALDTGIQPIINTSISPREPGRSQAGAGLVRAPMECFKKAFLALVEKYNLAQKS